MSKASSTRDTIVQAALALFSERGYVGATTREIARAAGISEVTLFRQFTSKEKLLEEVVSAKSFLPTMKNLLSEASSLPYKDSLGMVAHRLIDFYVSRKDLIRLIHAEVQRSPGSELHQFYHLHMDGFYSTLADYFSILQGREELHDFDPLHGAMAFHGLFFSYFNMEDILCRNVYSKTDRNKAIKDFVEIFARGTLRCTHKDTYA